MREAITRANQNQGVDSIVFAITGNSKSIKLASPLPSLIDSVIIDATSQPGYVGSPIVELDGSLLSTRENGLTIEAPNCTVKGLAINSFVGDGILITGPGSNTIENNYLGIDLTGKVSSSNGGSGVQILESPNNRIGGPGAGNVLSGNRLEGLRIWGAKSMSNSVQGNRIGTDASGTSAVPNALSGVLIASGASGNTFGIGFADNDPTGKGNVVAGNLESGVRIGNASQNLIKGNYLGLDASGTRVLGNKLDGVLIEGGSAGNIVGSDADGISDRQERNWISGNLDNGIRLFNASTTQIVGNWIGLDINGNVAPNASNGILIDGKSTNNTVGSQYGILEDSRNIIAGNAKSGIEIYDSTGNRVSGNYVGTSPDGLSAIPNFDGIVVSRGSDNNVIGLGRDGVTSSRVGNLVSGNLRNGVWLVESMNSKVAGNVIGLAADGLNALPNQHSGIWISQGAHDNVIGVESAGTLSRLDQNVVAGNLKQGVSIGGVGADNNRVAGNLIGTDITGARAVPNQDGGVLIYDQAKKNKIGGVFLEQKNYISGNQGWGVSVEFNASETSLLGNRIGVVEGSQSVLGNTSGGIRISQSSNNQIGDGSAGGSNWISNNGPVGIQIIHADSTGNALTNNYISNHSTIGIDLGGDGPTPNDFRDADTGPNQLQNYPVVETVGVSASRTQITGRLESTPNSSFKLDVFSQEPGVPGNRFQASVDVTTNSDGIAYWLVDRPFGIATNSIVYATARNTAGSQSEISQAKQAGQLFSMQSASNQLREGGPSLLVTLQRPTPDTSQLLTVNLSSSDPSQLTHPAQVTFPVGQHTITFLVQATDDGILEFPKLVQLTAESTTPDVISATIQLTVLDNDSQWHNYVLPQDVDHDEDVSPLDVIVIINYLNSNQSTNLSGLAPPTPRSYIDVDEDQFVTPLDVLIVINYLNQRSSGEGEKWGGDDEIVGAVAMNLDSIESWKRRNR